MRLTGSSLSIIGFAVKGLPKWGFVVILGVGAKILGGKVHPSLELRVFRHLWSRSLSLRVVEFCMGSLYPFAIGETLGEFGGFQLPYQKSQGNCAAGRHPFGPSTITWKNRNHSAM